MARKPYGCSAMFWGGLALLVPFASVKALVDIDYANEIETNRSFAKQNPAQLDSWKQDYTKDVKKRLSLLRRVLLSALAWLIFGVVAALVIVWWKGSSVSPSAKVFLGILSVFCFAWSTLARLGRGGTSMGGNTAVEWLDLRIMWLLYWIGTFLGTLVLV